jgi:hypothetical protein
MTDLRDGRPRFDSWQGQGFSFLPPRPNRLRGPSSLFFN